MPSKKDKKDKKGNTTPKISKKDKKGKKEKGKKAKKGKKGKKGSTFSAGIGKGVKSKDNSKLARESRNTSSRKNSKNNRSSKVRKSRGIGDAKGVIDIFIQGHGSSPSDETVENPGHLAHVLPEQRSKSVRESLGPSWNPGTPSKIPDIHPSTQPSGVPYWSKIRGMNESHIKSDTTQYESHFFNSATPMTDGYNGLGMIETANLMETVANLNKNGETTESSNHISKALNLTTTDDFKKKARPYSSSKENILIFLHESDISPGSMLSGHWPGIYNMALKPDTMNLQVISQTQACNITESVLNELAKKDYNYRGWKRCSNIIDRGWEFKDGSPLVVPLVRIEEALIALHNPNRINFYAHICQSRQDDLHYDTHEGAVRVPGRPTSRGILDSSEMDVKYLADSVQSMSLGEFRKPPIRLSPKEMTETHKRENDQTIYNQSLKKLRATSEKALDRLGGKTENQRKGSQILSTIEDRDESDESDESAPVRMEQPSGGGKKRNKKRRKKTRKRISRRKTRKRRKTKRKDA